MDTLPNLFDLLTWTEPKEVNTKRGPMMLRKAPVEDAFWPLWDRFQTQYRMMSFSLSKDLITHKPVLCHWSYLDQEELEKRAQTIQDSRAVQTSFRAPCPRGLDFYPFQHAGIQWITSREGSYIGDDMGLGKTVQAIGAANALPDCARILIVTKASLKLNWQRELKKWLTKTVKIGIAEGQKWPKTPVVVINYDILGKHYNALRAEPWDLVVLDECFVNGTPVCTPYGLKSIETIREGDLVLNANGFGTVTRTMKHVAYVLVSVVLENGEAFTCTPNHPWLTQYGWVMACELNETHYIKSHNEILRLLRNVLPGEKRSAEAEILRNVLLSEMANESTQDKEADIYSSTQQGHVSQFAGTLRHSPGMRGTNKQSNAAVESNAEPSYKSESKHCIKGNETWPKSTRREWNRTFESRTSNAKPVPMFAMELSCCGSEGAEPKGSELLQSGPSLAVAEAGSRSGWAESQYPGTTSEGPKERIDSPGVRVVSITHHEQESTTGNRSNCRGTWVYNLEVDGHPSYVIGRSNLVVHNCQAIKNPQAKRTLQILGHTPSKKRQEQGEKIIEPIPGRRRVALSGTPIENSIQDLWCVLHYLDSKRFPDFYKFCFRYAGMRKEFGRGFVCTGPTNTEELQRILRSTVMIRRLKRDVLKDLPPITRTIHELDPSGLEQYVRAEELAYKTKEKELLDGQLAVELARCEPDGDHFRATVKALGGASFSFEEIAKVRAETAFAMVPKVLPVIEDDISEAGKAIVFGHHRRVLNAIHDALPGSVLVTGETTIQARQAAVDRFQTDPGCKWFIGSTRACGEGITLTAANLVYFVEEDWAPSKISQAESRPHRIGQTGNVLVKHFIVPGTINARMINVCIEKQEMIEKTLDIDPEFGQEPLFTSYRPLGTRKEILSEAMLMSLQDRKEVLEGLKALSLPDLHQIDAKIVKHLVGAETITQGQAALGRRLLARYSQPGAAPAPAAQAPELQS